MKRLLQSVINANYPANTNIPLIISIDLNDNAEVYTLCEKFEWKFGDKKIIKHDQHLGLKQHILKCGDLTETYGSVIILEDDLMVSPWYYEYALKASSFYNSAENIAGIALYSYRFIENNFYPFAPVEDGSDVYFMQLPCSWGQLFNSAQWNAFRKWFEQHPTADEQVLPPYINQWSASSWKKHFTHYLIDTHKYFVFPRTSLITNFSEPGANSDRRGVYQVPLLSYNKDFSFTVLKDSAAIYDSDFELLPSALNRKTKIFEQYDYAVDMYGNKKLSAIKAPYLLSSKKCNNSLFSFGNDLSRSIDNILYNAEGDFYHFGKTADFIGETPEENNYYVEMNAIKDVAFNTYIKERLRADRFEMDNPAFHIIIDAGTNEKGLRTSLESIISQNYPHRRISVLVENGSSIGGLEKLVETISYANTPDFNSKLYDLIDASKATYLCILKAGETFYPEALKSVNAIIKRYPEILWLTGAVTSISTNGALAPNLSYNRWNKSIFEKRKKRNKTSGISSSATFWKKDVWDSARNSIRFTSKDNPAEDIWPVFFERHFLHTTGVPLVFSESNQRVSNALLENDPLTLLWERFFRNDVKYLRSVYKDRQKLLPVVRYDAASSSFYFSEY